MSDTLELGPHKDVIDGGVSAKMMDMDGIESMVLKTSILNHIRVRWHTEGSLPGSDLLMGEWHFKAAFERIGEKPPVDPGEFTLPDPTGPSLIKPYKPGPDSIDIDIPANTVPEGAYKIVVMLNLFNHNQKATFIGGFVEIPMVMFRE